jgi:hypothetical protein
VVSLVQHEVSYQLLDYIYVSCKPRRFNESQKATKSRQKLDSKSEDSLFRVLTNFGMFNFTNESEHLLSIATKDKATDVIKESPLNARKIGQKQLEDFVKDQLVLKDEEQSPKISLRTPISKNNPLTMASLYKIHTSSNPSEKGKIVKTDRNTLHRIVTAFKAGRKVNMSEILKHELMPVPIAIAETKGSLRSGNKSLLLDILLKNVDINGVIDFNDRSALIIDGQFLVQSLKHQDLRTFGEYADMYVGVVLRKCVRFRRMDLVFDRYRTQSIKSGTRKKRSK